MNNRKNIWVDMMAIGLLFLSLIVLMFPWQIILINESYNNYFRLTFELIIILILIYFFIQTRKYKKTLKWIVRLAIIPVMVYGLSIVFLQFIYSSPKQTTYAIFYTKPQDSKQKIKILHNHGFIQSWNEIKHVIEYPKWGFRLEKEFDLNNLQGEWYVHADNPYHQTEGLTTFRNGEQIKKE